MSTETKQINPGEMKVSRPYSCVDSPPSTRSDSSGGKTPVDIAKEFHEKCVLVSVADMHGQL
ncbi:hypothetical protein A3J77_00260 [Candidatus Wolfebacteria bacterium RBG_13_41_7]|uniref:Uncharacterized protein n=1 Tax=Candidatus Wolfebacteria bacterium RBG_13_41_7 TaxID=1802554 RepID=A0A1F8DNQ0_9BACT|nr:MAG: hypothetical protein A3J77_00260 [Candidatus Wolfebacteria bacterium RBG_13_41_7]